MCIYCFINSLVFYMFRPPIVVIFKEIKGDRTYLLLIFFEPVSYLLMADVGSRDISSVE
jgi:hypothetical protein